MVTEFETKKVPIETLGEYLSSIRSQLDLTLEEVSQKTGIFEKFILFLEEGKYQKLPPDVYVLGFLKKIAELYQVSYEDLVGQFKKERGIVDHAEGNQPEPAKGLRSFLANISITPKLVTLSGGVLLGAGVFVYILIQVFSVNRTPSLTITEPQSGTVLKASSVEVIGKTEAGMSVAVNGQNVFVNPDGSFKTTLSVVPGQKEFRVVAQNKFGKQREELVSLRIEDSQVAGAVTEQPSELVLELQFTKATTITIERDGVVLPQETVPAAATKKIVANDDIVVKTSDAGSTKATFNGQQLGSLGKVGQELSVPFNKESQNFLNSQISDSVSAETVKEKSN